jgi:hypothetical protein
MRAYLGPFRADPTGLHKEGSVAKFPTQAVAVGFWYCASSSSRSLQISATSSSRYSCEKCHDA